jgi:hypothetical protein
MVTPVIMFARQDVKYVARLEKTNLEVLALDAKNGDVLATPEPILVPSRNKVAMETQVSVMRPESKVVAVFGSRYVLSLDFTNESENAEDSSTEDSSTKNEKPEKKVAPIVK